MKKIYIISILILGLILCSSCTKEGEILFYTSVNEKYFDIESVVTSADGLLATNMEYHDGVYYVSILDMQTGKEQINMYDESFTFLGDLNDEFSNINQNYCRMSSFCLYDESIFFVIMNEDGSVDGRQLLQYNLDGEEISRISLETSNEIWDGRVLNDIYVTDDCIILVSGVGIQICDKFGQTISEIYSNTKYEYYIDSTTIKGNYLYYGCTEEYIPYVYKFDIKSGNVVWKQKFTFGNYIRNICSFDDEIMIQNEYELQIIDEDNGQITTICDLRDYNATRTQEVSYYTSIFDLCSVEGSTVLLQQVWMGLG